MTPEELGARLVAALGGAADVAASVSGGGAWARATVEVPVGRWRDGVERSRHSLECDFFDWLSAVDELAEGFALVAHVWSTRHRYGLLLRTRVPREAPELPSIVDIYPGAGWHERETHEMFGIDFAGHPNLEPLLLPPEFEGHPLRKEFVLASRVAKAWPGAKEPGESHAPTAGARRQPMRPPGVPDPNEWGPQAGTLAAGSDAPTARPRRTPPGERPARPAPRAERPASTGVNPVPAEPTGEG